LGAERVAGVLQHAVEQMVRPDPGIAPLRGVAGGEQLATGTNRLVVMRVGAAGSVEINLTKVFSAASDRHVEIMRDDLSEIYYAAARDDMEYVFGDWITAISPDGKVAFAKGVPRRFDLVIGADGLHSGVRRLVFGDEARHTHLAGAYLAFLSVPKGLGRDGVMRMHVGVGREAGVYTARHLTDARMGFLFRSDRGLAITIATYRGRRSCCARPSSGCTRTWTDGSLSWSTPRPSTSTPSPSSSSIPGHGAG
jgi:2-polyprenyl-6-methoxyphenol hydroxylase-like FAD-dependent oxidoreductase